MIFIGEANFMMNTYLTKIGRLLVVLVAGFVLTRCSEGDNNPAPGVITPDTALESYLNNGDTTFHWSVTSTYTLAGVTAYELFLTSQKWHDITWVHQLTILVPPNVQYEGALLWITGGKIKNGEPKWEDPDGETWAFTTLALQNNAITAILRQTPNQPLFNGLTEDALISYTLFQFKNDGDYTWPLLFPMVKSAVRAMDAIQEFAQKELRRNVSSFVVSGGSKRGWTTWLTGSQDNRVEAIAPAVIDVLNMPVNLDYQLEAWGAYSPEIQDYVDLGIPQDVHTGQGQAITTMIDPYSYRQKLVMPKMILLGTNDPYWPVDAIKNYYDDIPGQNYILYVPNAGHDLGGGEEALRTLNAFFYNTLNGQHYPDCSWVVDTSSKGLTLKVRASEDVLLKAYLWSAVSEDRDFRNEHWNSIELPPATGGTVSLSVDYPDAGYKAFYVDLEYPDATGGTYFKSTRMFVVDAGELL